TGAQSKNYFTQNFPRSRFPGINILIAPCIVQGEDAPDSIVAAIEELNHPTIQIRILFGIENKKLQKRRPLIDYYKSDQKALATSKS
ncbi:hypothetical protein JQ310_20485, partial [Leptospira interrogans]|nr:hypothetical protein [Leptospira interrogans]